MFLRLRTERSVLPFVFFGPLTVYVGSACTVEHDAQLDFSILDVVQAENLDGMCSRSSSTVCSLTCSAGFLSTTGVNGSVLLSRCSSDLRCLWGSISVCSFNSVC